MMINGQYTWTDRKDTVKVHIPLKGVAANKVDIRVTPLTLKVNFSPYMIDFVLFDKIDAVKHKATVKEGILTITLFKIEAIEWIKLENDVMMDKSKASELRKESHADHEQIQKVLDDNKKSRKIEDERLSVRKQMAADELERADLEYLKAAEKKQAEQEVYDTFAKMENKKQQNHQHQHHKKAIKFASTDDIEENIDEFLEDDDIEDNIVNQRIKHTPSTHNHMNQDDINQDSDVKYLPPPRSDTNTKIDINFTPRVFPTPLRESKAADEENWVAKNSKYLKNHSTLGQNLPKGKDIGESDPAWLKAKGDDFFRSGDSMSAISAYSSAVDADPKLIACYSNRAACYMKVKMYIECKADCDTGLRLLKQDATSASSNQVLYIKLLLRRGVTCCQLGDYEASIVDHREIASILQVSSSEIINIPGLSLSQIINDVKNLEKLRDCDQLKKDGDRLFGDKQVDQAITKYSDALNILPIHVGCLSNRAASKLASADFEGCIIDCSNALEILQANLQDENMLINHNQGINMMFAILPVYGSEKRKQYIVKTITRRGVAYRQLQRHEYAIADYEAAVRINPNNEALRKDLDTMKLQYHQSSVTQ